MESPGRPRAVVFDYGAVICRPPDLEEWTEFATAARLPLDDFIRLYPRSRERYDRGLVRAQQFWREFATMAGRVYDDEAIRRLAEIDIRVWSHVDPEMIAFARDLQRFGIVTGILSNMQPDLLEQIRGRTEWTAAFDVQVFSCDIGLVKPEPGIYEYLLGQLRVPARDVFFIDDVSDNVDAARVAGLQAEMFTSIDDLRRVLGSSE